MWATSEDAVTDTQMELLPSFLGQADGWGECQCVTIGLGWGHTDGPVHVTLPSQAADRVGAERMHALTMKASVVSKQAVEDTVTDTQTDHLWAARACMPSLRIRHDCITYVSGVR